MASSGGCQCGKPKPGPLGSSKPKPPVGSSMTGNTQSFTLQLGNGRTQSFTGSQLEAQAAAVRLGATLKF